MILVGIIPFINVGVTKLSPPNLVSCYKWGNRASEHITQAWQLLIYLGTSFSKMFICNKSSPLLINSYISPLYNSIKNRDKILSTRKGLENSFSSSSPGSSNILSWKIKPQLCPWVDHSVSVISEFHLFQNYVRCCPSISSSPGNIKSHRRIVKN